MVADVIDLRDFYDSALGHATRRTIRRHVRQIWPDLSAQRVLGLGYATPYLRSYLGEAERVLAFMPAPQGVLHWPPEGPNTTSLVEESDLPLTDMSVDRVILVHALEHAEQLRPFLREIWRVMAGGGRLLIVAPNRRGLWARLDRTPFGYGHPYTANQLSRLLRDNLFTPLATRSALFMPPFASRVLLTSAGAWERVGARLFPRFAGVVIVEASKQLYAPTLVRAAPRKRLRALPVPQAANYQGR
ncbi:MAG TPA: methyltransferase domain-containing protein [Alphaproteobacteria bacterium]|jgi:SAM-dependent methyltransferase|nr:methyltransferase domain-containing protein [Alphaproteobacteria bacterium]